MRWWRRPRPEKSQDIPVYGQETPAVQLRIMRTHIAAQAGEMSNMRVKLDMIADRLTAVTDAAQVVIERQDEQRDVYMQLKHLRDEIRTAAGR